MFYVCKKVNGKYGVIDTDDGVIEYYTPEQVCAFAKKTKIHGVEFRTTGVAIEVVIPKVFEALSKDFYPISLYDVKQAQGKAAKFSFTGKLFYKIFDEIPLKGNIPNVYLELDYWGYDEIAFKMATDYSTGLTQQYDVVASQMQEIFNNSPYKNYVSLANSHNLIYALKYKEPFVFLKIPRAYKDFVISQVTDLCNSKTALDKAYKGESFDFENLRLNVYKAKTNVGIVNVFDLLFNYEGLVICLACHSRVEYSFTNPKASDSFEFLIKKLKED